MMKELNFQQMKHVSGGSYAIDFQMFGIGAGLSLGAVAGVVGTTSFVGLEILPAAIGTLVGSAYGTAAFATVGMVAGAVGLGSLGFVAGLSVDLYSHFSQWQQNRKK